MVDRRTARSAKRSSGDDTVNRWVRPFGGGGYFRFDDILESSLRNSSFVAATRARNAAVWCFEFDTLILHVNSVAGSCKKPTSSFGVSIMPIPERFRVPRFTKADVAKLSKLCDEIEDGVNGHEDVSELLAEWHRYARRQFEPREFTTYYGSMEKKEFVKSALLPPAGRIEDLKYDECKAIVSAFAHAEIRNQAEQAYYLELLESNFPDSNMSDLLFWPNHWFGDDSYFMDGPQFRPDRNLSVDQILRYAMLKSGRVLPDAPEGVVLPLPLRKAAESEHNG